MVEESDPDTVVLATGGLPLIINFPGLEEANWVSAHDLLEGEADVITDSAFVIGGGLVGLETADLLASQGKQVVMVEMMGELAPGMDKLAKGMLIDRLQKEAVMVHTHTAVKRLTADTVVAESGGEEIVFPAETVVMAVAVRSNRDLVEVLSSDDASFEIHVIGDAAEPRKALEAIQEGFEVGLTV